MLKMLTEVTPEVTEKAELFSNQWVLDNKPVLIFVGCATVVGLTIAVVWKKVFKKQRGYRG